MFTQIRKISLIAMVIFGWLFSGFPALEIVDAAIGDIGHWRDSVGSQIPGTAFGAFSFNDEIQNNGIYTKPNASTIELDEAGDYLIIATMRDSDTSNGRYNAQARVALTSGTGTLFSSYYSGYSRDTSENQAWTRAIGVIIGASANAQVQVQKRRDTDTPIGGSVVGRSDVQVIRINPTNHGIYGIGGTGNVYGGTTPNLVDVDTVVSESNTAAIEGNTTAETITIKGDNKKYLVAWSTSFTGAANRTQRIGHLEYDGVDELPTRSYCYTRNAANEYCGLGSMDIIETGTADIVIQAEVYRGDGVAADQGGALVDETAATDGNGQMIVLEMPDYLEVFRSHDSTGLQDVTAAQTMNIARDVDFNDSLSFTKASNTAVDVTNPADIFSWANIWTARNNIASGARQTSFGSITINGVEQSTGEHGNYSRGNQSTTDTFGMSFHPAGIFTVGTAGHDIGVNSDPLAGGEAGGTDRTQPNTLGFFALNLDTLVEPQLEQSAYRLFNNTNSTDVGTALAAQDTAGTLAATGDAFRLRTLVNVSDNQLRQNETDFKLQFAQRVGTCDVGFTGESYTDVTASTLIAFNDNAAPNDGDNLTANVNDPINGANTIVNQDYEELNNFTPSVSAIGQDQDGKWDFSLIDNGAPTNTSYCFRIVESDGTSLDTYTVIPEITTALGAGPGGIPVDLNLWLRADAEVFNTGTIQATDGQNVESWGDQTVADHDVEQLVTTAQPLWRENSINFNPAVDFERNDDVLTNPNSPFVNDDYDESNIFFVAVEDTRQASSLFGFRPDPSRIQAHYTWSDGNIYFDIGGAGAPARISAAAPFVVGEPTVGTFINSVSNSNQEININGNTLISDNSGQSLKATNTEIGKWSTTGGLNGKIAEFITYSSDLTLTEKNQIQSYLGLKYGITLDQSAVSGGINYSDSSGATYWSQDTGDVYENDIFGLGRDDTTDLDQRVSQSVNSDAIITMALDNDFLTANTDIATRTTAHGNDRQFLTLANNNVSTALQTTELDTATYSERIGREWQIQKTANFAQTVNLKFDGFDDEFVVLMDADGDFSSGAVNLGSLDGNGEITGLDLFNTQYITLAKDTLVIPQTLSFNVFDSDTNNSIGHDLLSTANVRYATTDETGSTTAVTGHSITASTNAANGYIIEMDGITLTSMDGLGTTIDAIGGTATASTSGTEQFGMRLIPTGTGTSSTPYNTANFAYDTANFVDIVATGIGDDTLTTFAAEYIANIDPLTPAGNYTATVTYTMHAEF